MVDPIINRPFPIFRAITIAILAIVSRVVKWVIPTFCMIIFIAWVFAVMLHLVQDNPLRVNGGGSITLIDALTNMGEIAGVGIVCFIVGELLIGLNERHARSIARYLGEDIDKM